MSEDKRRMDLRAGLFVILTIVGYGMWGFLGKVGSQAIGKYQYIFLSYLVALGIFTGFFWFSAGGRLLWSRTLLLPLAGGLCTGLAIVSFFSAIERIPLSVASPLTALYPAMTVILSFIFLGERLSAVQSLGVVLALLSGVLLSR